MTVTTSYRYFSEGPLYLPEPAYTTTPLTVLALASGGVVTAGSNGTNTQLLFLTSAGEPTGPESLVGPITGTDPSLVQLSNGNIVVLTQDGSDLSFLMLSAAGAVISTPGTIAGVSGGRIAVAGSGFVIVAETENLGNNVIELYYSNALGMQTGYAAIPDMGGSNRLADLMTLGNGNTLVVWEHDPDPTYSELVLCIIDPATGSLTQQVVDFSIGFALEPRVLAHPNGGFAVFYLRKNGAGGADILMRIHDANGDLVETTGLRTGEADTVILSDLDVTTVPGVGFMVS